MIGLEGVVWVDLLTSKAFVYKAIASSIKPCSRLIFAKLFKESAWVGQRVNALL